MGCSQVISRFWLVRKDWLGFVVGWGFFPPILWVLFRIRVLGAAVCFCVVV